MSPNTTNRSRASLALATALALMAAMFAMAAPASAGQGPDKVTICHRTASETNPYRKITVNVDGSDGSLRGDHLSHQGPIWPDRDLSTGKWGDIVPPYGDFPGYNWTSSQTNPNDPTCPGPEDVTLTEVYPEEPSVTAPTCDAPGALNVPKDTAEITYVTNYRSGDTGSFSVTANVTDDEKYAFPNGTGMESFGPYEVLQQLSPNDPECVTAVTPPAPPAPLPPTCEANGTLVLPAPQTGVIWAVTPEGTGPGTYTTTATPAEGYTFGEATSRWEQVVLPKLTEGCSVPPPAAIPAAVTPPRFADATCAAPANMVIPADTAQIDYTTVGTATPGMTVTVTAKPIGNVVLTGYPANGWSFTFAAAPTNCDSAVGGTEDDDVETDNESDSADDEQAVAGSEDELAATGANAGPAGLGLLLILSGAAFITARRLALR